MSRHTKDFSSVSSGRSQKRNTGHPSFPQEKYWTPTFSAVKDIREKLGVQHCDDWMNVGCMMAVQVYLMILWGNNG